MKVRDDREPLLACSLIGTISMVKMAILPKLIYRTNAMSVKILRLYFTFFKKIQEFIWNQKILPAAKGILRSKYNASSTTISDLKYSTMLY